MSRTRKHVRLSGATLIAVVLATVAMPGVAHAIDWKSWTNYNSGLCMGVPAGNMYAGAGVIQWDCDGSEDQYWQIVPSNDNYYKIPNKRGFPNWCLATTNANAGTQLTVQPCNSANLGHYWQVAHNLSNGCKVLFNRGSDPRLSAGVIMGNRDRGTPVAQWTFDKSPDQSWC